MSLQGNVLSGKICCITGGTSGIGKETAIELARMGAMIVLPVRNSELGAEVRREIIEITGNSYIDLMSCDLASLVSVMSFAKTFQAKYDRLDILINNAGIMERTRKVSRDGIELTFAVNHLAHFLLTKLLLETIQHSAPARIINVSSEAHKNASIDFDDIEMKRQYSGFKAYGQSKLANILFTRKLSSMLIGTGITVNALHPGVVATNIFNVLPPLLRPIAKLFMLSPAEGAATSVYVASSPEVANITGEYFNKKKVALTSAKAQSPELAEQLWNLSEQYISV